MSYKFTVNGVEVTCETPEELRAALQALGKSVPSAARVASEADEEDPRRLAVKRSWEAAEKYAEEHGISKDEARRILAAEKKKKIAEALD